jgi:hypothetical protein
MQDYYYFLKRFGCVALALLSWTSVSYGQKILASACEFNNPPTLAPISDQNSDEGTLLRFAIFPHDDETPDQNLIYSLN